MTTTSAFFSTVEANRTIVLPNSIPIGAKVAVILLPTESDNDENVMRAARFQQVMNAIRNAINSNFMAPDISDQDLNQLIDEARQSAKAR
ncbi:MAG: hypothetical protein R2911_20430 [Caldilineaceae bacterium]